MNPFKYCGLLFCLGVLVSSSGLRGTSTEVLEDLPLEFLENQGESAGESLERPESVPLGQVQTAWDKASPTAGVYVVEFKPEQVIKIKTRPFMVSTIVLPDWEEIEEILLGDDHLFLVEKKSAHLVSILPRKEECDTSMTVIGASGTVYGFYIRSEPILSIHVPDVIIHVKAVPSVASVRNQRKHADPKTTKSKSFPVAHEKSAGDFLEALPLSLDDLSFAFEMSAKDTESMSIAPLHVYSDGLWIWLDYGHKWNKSTLPSVYRKVDGVDTPINTRIKGTKIIVQGFGPLTLKSGKKVVCIEPMTDSQ